MRVRAMLAHVGDSQVSAKPIPSAIGSSLARSRQYSLFPAQGPRGLAEQSQRQLYYDPVRDTESARAGSTQLQSAPAALHAHKPFPGAAPRRDVSWARGGKTVAFHHGQ